MQRIEKHDVIFRHRHKVDASGRQTRSRYTRAGQGRQHCALVQLDAMNMHAQGVARLGALDVKRPSRRIDAVPVQLLEGVAGLLNLVGKTVAGLEADTAAVCHT